MSTSANPAAAAVRMRSAGPPMASSTVRQEAPRPLARSIAAMAAGVSAVAESTSSRAPGCSAGRIASTGRPQAESSAVSATAQPSRARARAKADGAGWQVHSPAATWAASRLPTPKQNGSPDASTQVGRPRRARMAGKAASIGLGQGRVSDPIAWSARARWRRPPTTSPARATAARAAGGRWPSSPMPTMASQGAVMRQAPDERADPGWDDGGVGDRAGAGGRRTVRPRAVAGRAHPRLGAAAHSVAGRRLRRGGGAGRVPAAGGGGCADRRDASVRGADESERRGMHGRPAHRRAATGLGRGAGGPVDAGAEHGGGGGGARAGGAAGVPDRRPGRTGSVRATARLPRPQRRPARRCAGRGDLGHRARGRSARPTTSP